MSVSSREAFNDWQRQLDRDSFYQRLQDEIDQSWWQTMNGSETTSKPQDNYTEDRKWD